MGWPLSQDYNEAVQSPGRNFADPDLRRGQAVVNALGLPMPCSGNFADVYQLRCPDGSRWAVKCFTREVPGLHERYAEISAHLRRAKLRFTVDFTYLDQGIRVGGQWFPVLKMQWVEGMPLNQFVARSAEKPAVLEGLLHIWARMGQQLRAADVAHGDLQHGNVLLVRDANSLALKLVDYDGMWVPALVGRPSGEVGHPAYQHPHRAREGTYSPEVDRFPLLLVATALRALKSGGRALWEKYDNGDNLLFTDKDLNSPGRSTLFRELPTLGDPMTAALTEALLHALAGGVESAPVLEEVLRGESRTRMRTTALAIRRAGWPAAPVEGTSPPPGTPPDIDGHAPAANPPARTWGTGLLALGVVLAIVAAMGGAIYFAGRAATEQAADLVAQAQAPPADTARRRPPSAIPGDATPAAKGQAPPGKSPDTKATAKANPAAEGRGGDVSAIDMALNRARASYAVDVERARDALARHYEESLKALDAGGNRQAALKLREDTNLLRLDGILLGRDDLRNSTLEYGRSLKSARDALAGAYSAAIKGYTNAREPSKARATLAELTMLAPDARLVSLESYAHPGQFISHGDYLGWIKAPSSDGKRLNATFELVPGLASESCVSFRSVNIPRHYLVHADFRIRLQKLEDSDGYRRNGTFRQVGGLAFAAAASFESINYPGYYVHARGDKLFIDKYDGSARFRTEATFYVLGPQYKLW
jgi:hypothetical protein